MSRSDLDLVVAADPFRGGADGRHLAALLELAAGLGWRCGFLPLAGPPVRPARGLQKGLRELLATRRVRLLDPAEPARCRLALAFEALPLLELARRPRRIVAERALVRIEAPASAWADLLSAPNELLARAAPVLGAPAVLVPADPLVAESLMRDRYWRLLPRAREPWPLLAPAFPLPRPRTCLARIGRHGLGPFLAEAPLGRLDPLAREQRGHGPLQQVLAEEAAERALLDPATPADLELLPGDLRDACAFLDRLDAWVLAAATNWEPWLPAALVEALASGCPCLVPPALAPLMGTEVLAVEPERAGETLAALEPAELARLGEAGRAFASERFGPERLRARLEAELAAPAPPAAGFVLRREHERARRVLFLAPNGIGIGHLVRLAAIARRLPGGIEPVFLSLSQAVGLIRALGFPVEYTPAQAATRESQEGWAEGFRTRLAEAIAFWDPACVVFDGNVPYQPLVDLRLQHPDRPFVWLRRGLWRPDAGRATIERVRHFDLVIEPADLAAPLDRGITAGRELERVLVPPIVLLDREELLDRAAARAELGIDPSRTAVLLLLGSRNNFDYGPVDRVVAELLLPRPEVEPIALDWPISETDTALPAGVRRLARFPIARFFRAFDLAIAACGYNSFHELLAAGVPTVFVPNENPTMDEQERRALWAEAREVGLCARTTDPYRLFWAIDRLLDPTVRARLRAAMDGLPPPGGAAEAAALLAMLARSWPRDRRPDRLPAAMARA
ncbi:MAG: hypothetical protein RMK81_06070 [Geminicoccaceae bacterium]|nr:hypothetical protein [Geminicoccaceae bacterium]